MKNNPTYINRLKKNIRNPRIKLYQKVAGGMLIVLGILMVSHMSWAFYKLDQISQTEAECISLLTESDISAEDSTKLSIALRDLMTARIKMNNYTSSPYSMCAGAFIGFGIMVFCGSLIKRHEIIVSLWERVELLEKQLNTQESNKTANHR